MLSSCCLHSKISSPLLLLSLIFFFSFFWGAGGRRVCCPTLSLSALIITLCLTSSSQGLLSLLPPSWNTGRALLCLGLSCSFLLWFGEMPLLQSFVVPPSLRSYFLILFVLLLLLILFFAWFLWPDCYILWFIFANSSICFFPSFHIQLSSFPGSELLGLKHPARTTWEGAVVTGGLLLRPGRRPCLCVTGNGMCPTRAVGFPARTCLNYMTLVSWIGQCARSSAESAVVWQNTCLFFGSYSGSGGTGPPGIFSSSVWERDGENSAFRVPVLCWLMLQSSYLFISVDKSLLWWPFPTCVWADAVSSWILAPCSLLRAALPRAQGLAEKL